MLPKMLLCSTEESGAPALCRKVRGGLTCRMDVFGLEPLSEKCEDLLPCGVLGLLNLCS